MSVLRRAMMYIGLVDDDYDEYDGYDEGPVPQAPPMRTRPVGPVDAGPEPAVTGTVRTLREEGIVAAPTRPAVVRPITPIPAVRVHIVEPQSFNDAQEIGDRLKSGQPVIVVLRESDPDLSRRLIDFCSGASYVLDASIKKVEKKVYLITPVNVEVSAEERRRLQERGFIGR